jgi:hypothetical protein
MLLLLLTFLMSSFPDNAQIIERNLWSLYPPEEEDDEEQQLRAERQVSSSSSSSSSSDG